MILERLHDLFGSVKAELINAKDLFEVIIIRVSKIYIVTPIIELLIRVAR